MMTSVDDENDDIFHSVPQQNSDSEQQISEETSEKNNTTKISDDSSGKPKSDLIVDISDAVSDPEGVKFTVQTKTTLSTFKKNVFSVTRRHEEFIWLHDQLEETVDYAGLLFPPAPPRPDFDECRDKLQKLGDGENNIPQDEFAKIKKELEAEYLATFKKTVAMHEVFLQRLVAHPRFRADLNLRVFLDYEGDLLVRGKNRREKLTSLLSSVRKTADEHVMFQLQQSQEADQEPFFRGQKSAILELHTAVREAATRSDRLVRGHKAFASAFIPLASQCQGLATGEVDQIARFLAKFSEFAESCQKVETRIGSDEDLKLADTFHYYEKESRAARDLLYRRARALADQEAARKAFERARQRGKDVPAAELAYNNALDKFRTISDVAHDELENFNKRRIDYFQKNLIDLAKFNIRNETNKLNLIRQTLEELQSV